MPAFNPRIWPVTPKKRSAHTVSNANSSIRNTLRSAAFLLLAPVAFLGVAQAQNQVDGKLSEEYLPRTLKELNAWYVEPPQNAAKFYLQGFNSLQIESFRASNVPLIGKGKLPALGSIMPPSMKSEITAFVRANSIALQFFAKAASYKQTRYPVDLTMGAEAPFHHLTKLKAAAQLAELNAISHAEAKQAKEAATDVLLGMSLARSLKAEPSLLSQLLRVSTISTTVAALEQTINRTTLSSESLNELSKEFRKMEEYDTHGVGFTRAMAGERAMAIALFQDPKKLAAVAAAPGVKLPADQLNQVLARLERSDGLREEQQYFEAAFQMLFTARKKMFPERLKVDELVQQRIADANSKKLVLVGLLIPGLGGRVAKEAEGLAGLRLAMTAVALEQFRAAHQNRYPSSISELKPDYLAATLADPFDGQVLRYRRKENGYVMYSIGPDLKDNTGEPMSGKDGDILFTVVTPGFLAETR
jgi:hypothetical protein